MAGWSGNTQSVDLEGSSSVGHRVVYSVRNVPEQRVQFGTVKVDYGTVAVWRPYDPDDMSYEAPWKKGTWKNVYRIHVPRHTIPSQPGYVEYHIDQITVGECEARLPIVELQVVYQLKEYLKSG